MAIHFDENQRPEPIASWQIQHIEKLYNNCKLDFNLIHINEWTFDEANEFIELISKHQLDPVKEKGQYNATELNNFMQEKINNEKN